MPQSSKPLALMLLIALALNLFMVTLLAVTLNTAYERKTDEVRTNVANLALLMDQSVTGAAREVNLVLKKVQSRLETALRIDESLETSLVNELVSSREGWIGDTANIHITDASGVAWFKQDTGDNRSINYADRDYFITH